MPAITGFTTGEILTAANVNQYLLFGNENRIINGDFSVNQRGFSSSTATSGFGFDRWRQEYGGGTVTYSAQTFTVGNPITGQEPRNFAQIAVSGQSAAGHYALYEQFIESVRTFAGQTATISFWARATSGTPKVSVELIQSFGTGGSPSAATENNAGVVTISTTWARYAVTINVPSISGKTIGTSGTDYLALFFWLSAGSTYASRTNSIGIQNSTFQIWGVKIESGAVATPFLQRPPATELALCLRYCYRVDLEANLSVVAQSYFGGSASAVVVHNQMRARPTLTYNTTTNWQYYNNPAGWIGTTVTAFTAVSRNIMMYGADTGGMTGGTLVRNTGDVFLFFTAEIV